MSERLLSREGYTWWSRALEYSTYQLAGGFSGKREYHHLTSFGIQALPYLVEDLERRISWWQVEMVCELAQTTMQQCIYFDKETRGMPEPTRQRIIDWWALTGRGTYDELAGLADQQEGARPKVSLS